MVKLEEYFTKHIFQITFFVILSLIIAFFCFKVLESSVTYSGELGFIGGTIATGGGFAAFIVSFILLNNYYIKNKQNEGKKPEEEIEKISDRELYFNELIKAISSCKKSVLLNIRTLQASSNNPNVEMLQNSLLNAKTRHGDENVKIIAPGGRYHVQAAYELAEQKKLNIKFNPFITSDTFRFGLIDDETVILPMSSSRKKGDKPSDIAAIIRSEQLNYVLKDYFNKEWKNSKLLGYDNMLRKILDEEVYQDDQFSDESLSKQLKIPVTEISRIRGDFPSE